ncbi:MAG: hypothetical protein IIC67_06625 [Thaumarchaeota archaeon]|nr:hypothetical protein [Nitrososphaerota archaeon]
MRFECPGCDTILTRDAALKHTKHGGICNTMYPIRHETKSANDHDIEDRVRKIEEESNQHEKKKEEEKKVDEIAKADEDKIKRIEEIKKSLRGLSAEELDNELLKIREQLDDMKKDKTEDEDKQSKEASVEFIGVSNSDINTSRNSEYSVLTLGPYQDNSLSGDSLLIKLGSIDKHSKGDSSGDELLKLLGSVD